MSNIKTTGRRSFKDFKKVGGYDYGIYYNIHETEKWELMPERLTKIIELLEMELAKCEMRKNE
jgi:hypothetical protein